MKTPSDLKYTRDHEWVKLEGNIATVGITDFAQGELGDIVYVEIETVGETLKAEDVFGSIEAVKTVSDLFLPMDGEILEINSAIVDAPELVNEDPYKKGWLIKLKVSDPAQLSDLLSAEEYLELIA